MQPRSRVPLGVWIGLALAIILDTVVQVTWKVAVSRTGEGAHSAAILLATLRQPMFQLAMILFVCQFINWIVVLSKADLSYAMPITALSYISVAICSAIQLNEHISPARILGICLILLGVVFISQTPHRTSAPTAVEELV